ncbi:MAG: hypothetical protein BHV99_03005 [Clostridium sp. 26_21]|nr:MAG: hypothetical protein BHV99_03005 [Clostridium sp. 26_21]
MENVTKALLMAAGFLVAVIILSLLVMGYSQISRYYQEQSNTIDAEQMAEMTKKFTNYDGREIRGNEMLSVINMVVDYNNWVKENSNQGYKELVLNISFKNVQSYSNTTKYDEFHIIDGIDYLIPKNLQNNCITNKPNDKLKIFSTRVSELVNSLSQNSLITNNSVKVEGTLQTLSANVHNINDWLKKTDNTNNDNSKMASLLDSILKTNLNSDNPDDVKRNLNNAKNNIQDIRNIAAKYYEIMQFKRAYFKCEGDNGNTGVELDNNGKVKTMNFIIKTNDSGAIKFN